MYTCLNYIMSSIYKLLHFIGLWVVISKRCQQPCAIIGDSITPLLPSTFDQPLANWMLALSSFRAILPWDSLISMASYGRRIMVQLYAA